MKRLTPWMLGLALCSANARAQVTSRISLGVGGAQANADTTFVFMAPDGVWACFESAATNLVPGDTNGVTDVFARNLDTGLVELASLGNAGQLGDGACFSSSISADGHYVAFGSAATNLVPGDTNGATDIFVRDRFGNTTERVSLDSNGNQTHNPYAPYGEARFPRITPDGRFVVFDSAANDLVAGDTNATIDVFVRDRATGQTEMVSVGAGGALGNGESVRASISNDGRWIAFASRASNMVVGDTNATQDILVRDRQLGTTERIVGQGGAEPDGASKDPWVSSNARFVAFAALATNLVPGDTNGTWDVFVADRQAGTLERASVSSAGAEANGASERARISADGRFVVFESAATNLVANDTNGTTDIFVHDRLSGLTERVSVASSGAQCTGACTTASISRDGSRVAWLSIAADLVASDTNAAQDAFLRDRGPEVGAAFCNGDGSATACPCGNSSSPGANAGCLNSLGTGGRLAATGTPSASADTLVLSGDGMPDGSALYFQGTTQQNAGLGAVFGDGLRCAGGTVIRLALKTNVAGASTYPAGSDPPISVQGAIAGGDVRTYQIWYRNPAAFCTSATFNLSNGWQLVWRP